MRSFRSRHREELIAATVRLVTVTSSGAVHRSGTGFLLAPGRVVTCAHVVPELDGGKYLVHYKGTPVEATVVHRHPAEGADKLFFFPDVALLTVPVGEHPCVRLRNTPPQPADQLYAYGFPVVASRPFADHMFLRAVGPLADVESGNEFLKTAGDQVRQGASGSPVLDDTLGALVGMIVQTRDQNQDLGAVLVPTAAILAALTPADPTLVTDNAEAVGAADVPYRLNWVLQNMANELADVSAIHQRSMLMKLYGELPSGFETDDVALALLNLDINDLTTALRELARACRKAAAPEGVLEYAAPFAWVGDRPWVEPDIAEQLVAERRSRWPRVIHLSVGSVRSVQLHLSRAGVDGAWRAIPLTVRDAETDEETGLPARLVDALRLELLDTIGVSPEQDSAAIRAEWLANSENLRRVAGELAFVLPLGCADSDLVDRLRTHFAPFIFIVSDRRLSPVQQENPAMLLLPVAPALSGGPDDEARYLGILHSIQAAAERKATR